MSKSDIASITFQDDRFAQKISNLDNILSWLFHPESGAINSEGRRSERFLISSLVNR